MSTHPPIEIDIPHTLGRAAARERIERRFGKIVDHIPGGRITDNRWTGDVLDFVVEALGQRVAVRLDVEDTKVHAAFTLPPFLALFAGQIRARLAKEGPRLLE